MTKQQSPIEAIRIKILNGHVDQAMNLIDEWEKNKNQKISPEKLKCWAKAGIINCLTMHFFNSVEEILNRWPLTENELIEDEIQKVYCIVILTNLTLHRGTDILNILNKIPLIITKETQERLNLYELENLDTATEEVMKTIKKTGRENDSSKN